MKKKRFAEGGTASMDPIMYSGDMYENLSNPRGLNPSELEGYREGAREGTEEGLSYIPDIASFFTPVGRAFRGIKMGGTKALELARPYITKGFKAASAKKKKFSMGYNKGGSVKSSASSRADGIAQRGKTKGRNC